MQGFSQALAQHGLTARVSETTSPERSVRLEIAHGDEIDFVYEVVNREHLLPDAALIGNTGEQRSTQTYHRAEVYLGEGGQDYDIMGWTKEQIASDITDQYEKHRRFLDTLR